MTRFLDIINLTLSNSHAIEVNGCSERALSVVISAFMDVGAYHGEHQSRGIARTASNGGVLDALHAEGHLN